MDLKLGREKLRDISTILFDLDNTLIDTRGIALRACKEVSRYLCENGMRDIAAEMSSKKFFEHLCKMPEDPGPTQMDVDQWRTLLWVQALGPKYQFFAREAYDIFKTKTMSNFKLSRDVENMLLDLRKHYKLGLITNGSSKAQWAKVESIDGKQYFDVILVGGDYNQGKPHATIFEKAFQALDVSPKDCIMVGDNLWSDIFGGIQAGVMATVWIVRNEDGYKELDYQPDYKLRNICELLDLLPAQGSFSGLRTKRSFEFYSPVYSS
ncbi:N-acylneuraminate-9-phosphatase isoform X1 [Tachypleus tridentatus]|uniref:N-acylneuraminate-9-phosphatase isoform X1 n=2 Tax=Tachypleus tridentatus TaxID=6853 RepID=UPI003FD4F91B